MTKLKKPLQQILSKSETERLVVVYNNYVKEWNEYERNHIPGPEDKQFEVMSLVSWRPGICFNLRSEEFTVPIEVPADKKWNDPAKLTLWTPFYNIVTKKKWDMFEPGLSYIKHTITTKDIRSAKIFYTGGCGVRTTVLIS